MNPRVARCLMAAGLAAATAVLPLRAQDVLGGTGVRGAGSTFVYPVLSRWSREYRAAQARGTDFPIANAGLDDAFANSALEYEAVGSLAGTLRLLDGAVDVAATDMPMHSDELAKLGLAQFPVVIGGVAVAINIDGIGPREFRLTGPLLADVFLGKITRWSDTAIRALNPHVSLPDAPIVVVHRSDGSGTTFNFAHYLSKVSAEWRLRVGSGLLVSWPVGTGARGNEGVARAVQQTRNSIGYVEYAQAEQAGLKHALLQNRAGQFVSAQPAGFQAAAESAEWTTTTDFYVLLTDMAGERAYPITATVFALMHKTAPRGRTGAALDFFRRSLESGSGTTRRLGYVPLPGPLIQQVRSYWTRTFKITI
jgi:phosphate transport system substrate-binding protein